jgi:hypothetical protein
LKNVNASVLTMSRDSACAAFFQALITAARRGVSVSCQLTFPPVSTSSLILTATSGQHYHLNGESKADIVAATRWVNSLPAITVSPSNPDA